MPPEGITTFNFQKLPQQQQQQQQQQQSRLQYQQVRHALPSTTSVSIICDKSVHTRTSHLRNQFHQQRIRLRGRYRTSSTLRIANIFETYLEDYFVAGEYFVTPVLLPRLHLETSQTAYLFSHTTLKLPFLQLLTNLSTSMVTKTSCSSAKH